MKEYSGKLAATTGAKFAVVVGRFNEFITSKLLSGCIDRLTRHGVAEDDIDVVWRGGFEMPVLAHKLAGGGRYAAVICLGAVIRGGTDHWQYVAAQVSRGVAQVALETGVPCLFGVLTCQTLEQAIERAGAKGGNKGSQAAEAALEMVDLISQLPPAGR